VGAEVKSLADFRVPFVVDTVVPSMGAAIGGMQKGDSIVTVNGEPAAWFHQFSAILADNKGKEVTVTVIRDTTLGKPNCSGIRQRKGRHWQYQYAGHV
jgi:regulator of sigma E protease